MVRRLCQRPRRDRSSPDASRPLSRGTTRQIAGASMHGRHASSTCSRPARSTTRTARAVRRRTTSGSRNSTGGASHSQPRVASLGRSAVARGSGRCLPVAHPAVVIGPRVRSLASRVVNPGGSPRAHDAGHPRTTACRGSDETPKPRPSHTVGGGRLSPVPRSWHAPTRAEGVPARFRTARHPSDLRDTPVTWQTRRAQRVGLSPAAC